ncbi:NlpC/P60 family protein [Nocardioides sp.]|uniref:C40 family peptidase n=1 Tax=Nocardioides sp. TaxID=35761 RepID=UPI002718D7FB|nr:NlpC/P60 family protein [Nocardioides sp.]MDO9458451.1 NlpC/P60 family protein [Nocardioides sp.]
MRIASAVSGIALVASLGLVSSSPAQAEPEIKDVQARVDRLFHEAEQASERYNDAKIELDELTEDLGAVKSDESRAETSLDAIRRDARRAILRQYGSGDLGVVSQVVTAGDPGAFLDDVSTMSTYNQLQQGLFDDYETGLEALSIRRDATEKRIGQVADLEAELADEKATIDDKLADAKDLLGRLKEKERREILSRDGTTRVPSDVPASGRAGAAVSYAMAQVGDAYVYGAAGPSAFDCSGLTMMAWAQAGVSLPHSSSAQYSSGTHVAASALQPGDLVFYYSPISHVGMYIGNGMIVHAANPSSGVRVAELYSMPYVGAVRPG